MLEDFMRSPAVAMACRQCDRVRTQTLRFTPEMIPFVSPHLEVMVPDMGTNEQTMARMMRTYSMHAGKPVPRIVIGKPVALRGIRRPQANHWPRVHSSWRVAEFCSRVPAENLPKATTG